MWSPVPLFALVIVFQILNNVVAQLGNSTFSAEDILDIYEPLALRGNTTTRIVGGKPINIRQVPWQIALYINGYLACGGSIISRHWVLTAAHCVNSGGSFAIRAGSPSARGGGQIRFAAVVVINGAYNVQTMNQDIALIRVRSPFKWTSRVRRIKLARPNTQLPPRYFVSGWGTLSSNGATPTRIRGVTLRTVNRSVCRQKYNAANIQITKHMICAASPGKDACQGDSGGPLVYKNIQYGIVSFGIGCANANYPGVYTNLRRQYRWIRKVIRRVGGQMPL